MAKDKLQELSRCVHEVQNLLSNSCYLNVTECLLCPKQHHALVSLQSVGRSWPSLSSCHDFEVLQCIMGCIGSSSIDARSEAMAYRDWLSGQLHKTLAQAAQTPLLCNQRDITNTETESNFLVSQADFSDSNRLPSLQIGLGLGLVFLVLKVPRTLCSVVGTILCSWYSRCIRSLTGQPLIKGM